MIVMKLPAWVRKGSTHRSGERIEQDNRRDEMEAAAPVIVPPPHLMVGGRRHRPTGAARRRCVTTSQTTVRRDIPRANEGIGGSRQRRVGFPSTTMLAQPRSSRVQRFR